MASNTADRTFTVRSAAALADLAATIGGNVAAGDRIALFGELGAGKTVFVRGLARGLLHPEPRDIVSPTFAIHNRYPGGRLVLDHLDVYRLAPPVSLAREGLDTVIVDPATVLCCEWAERLDQPLPGLALEVHLALAGEDTRDLLLRAPRAAWERLFRGLG